MDREIGAAVVRRGTETEIKKMETEEETMGKAYVHWRSWHATYPGLVSPAYLNALTLEKCEEIARRWPDNILVAKDGVRVVGFVGYGESTEEAGAGEIYALYVLGILRNGSRSEADEGRTGTARGVSAGLCLASEGEPESFSVLSEMRVFSRREREAQPLRRCGGDQDGPGSVISGLSSGIPTVRRSGSCPDRPRIETVRMVICRTGR